MKDGVSMASEAPREEPSPSNGEEGDKTLVVNSSLVSQEIPTDVRVKLRRLEKLESKYFGLFRVRYVFSLS